MGKKSLENKFSDILDEPVRNKEATLNYRIDSTISVLNYLKNNINIDDEYLRTLITHCHNKLAGNIDGIELDLKGDGKSE